MSPGREHPEPDGTPAGLIEVPHRELAPDTLRRVVEEFVTRAGTDYGLHEKTLDEKVADVMRQLERGEARIVFDPETGSVNVAPALQESMARTAASAAGARREPSATGSKSRPRR